jgi:hypothetical protein
MNAVHIVLAAVLVTSCSGTHFSGNNRTVKKSAYKSGTQRSGSGGADATSAGNDGNSKSGSGSDPNTRVPEVSNGDLSDSSSISSSEGNQDSSNRESQKQDGNGIDDTASRSGTPGSGDTPSRSSTPGLGVETASATTEPQTCYVDDEAAIHIDLTGNAPKHYHYNNLALDLEFNKDAFEFKVALIQVVVDDGKPIVQIGGQKVFENGGSGQAQSYDMDVSLNNLLKGGKNLVQGSFYDEYGQQAKLSIKLRGTWKTNEKSCFKDFSHRYKL